MLILWLLSLAQSAPTSNSLTPENLSEALYWASAEASGSRLCDRRRGARYEEQFNYRYGERVQKLTQYHIAKFGHDPDFIVTTSCRASRRPEWQQDKDHVLAMDRFEATLRELERRFGPVTNGS